MGKDRNGEYRIGYLLVNEPWYSRKEEWTYYIVRNKYGRGYCGGASDCGFESFIVDPDSIVPYTQTAHIKYNQSIGVDTVLAKDTWKYTMDISDESLVVAYVRVNDEIPLNLWTGV